MSRLAYLFLSEKAHCKHSRKVNTIPVALTTFTEENCCSNIYLVEDLDFDSIAVWLMGAGAPTGDRSCKATSDVGAKTETETIIISMKQSSTICRKIAENCNGR